MSGTVEIFTIEPADWDKLLELSDRAARTPVLLVRGLDISANAHDDVRRFWAQLAEQYGFVLDTVRPHNEAARQVRAVRTNTPAAPADTAGTP